MFLQSLNKFTICKNAVTVYVWAETKASNQTQESFECWRNTCQRLQFGIVPITKTKYFPYVFPWIYSMQFM